MNSNSNLFTVRKDIDCIKTLLDQEVELKKTLLLVGFQIKTLPKITPLESCHLHTIINEYVHYLKWPLTPITIK